MAHPYHHALSSVKKWGGTADDYIEIHSWYDQSKELIADFRHRALRHPPKEFGNPRRFSARPSRSRPGA